MFRWIQPEKARYYHAQLIEDLFGDWTLVSCWGSLGSKQSRMRKTGVASYAAGLDRIRTIDRRRRLHGYRLTESSSAIPH